MNPAVVLISASCVPAKSTVLSSLEKAEVPAGVHLIVLLSAEGAEPAWTAALTTAWSHGPVALHYVSRRGDPDAAHEQAAGLASTYGAVIILPDDVVVSPEFYSYAQSAIAAYAGDDQVAAISLFNLTVNCQTGQPFIPLPDLGDSYFIGTSWPDGTVYTAAQWATFLSWRERAVASIIPTEPVTCASLYQANHTPPGWLSYLATTQRVCAFPRDSLASAGPGGNPFRETWRRPPLNLFKRQFDFIPLAESVAVYDERFEMQPDRLNRLTDRFVGNAYNLDLYATRDLDAVTSGYVITSRRCTEATETFAKLMRPMEANLIAGLTGNELSLAPVGAIDRSAEAARMARLANSAYFRRHQVTGGRHLLASYAAEWRQEHFSARWSGGQ